MSGNRRSLLESLNIEHLCDPKAVRVYSRSTSAILDLRLRTENPNSRSPPSRVSALPVGAKGSRAMALSQRDGQDKSSFTSPAGKEGRREGAKRSGVAAECGLCLDEFLDWGNKVPRNLLCGHTFCTG